MTEPQTPAVPDSERGEPRCVKCGRLQDKNVTAYCKSDNDSYCEFAPVQPAQPAAPTDDRGWPIMRVVDYPAAPPTEGLPPSDLKANAREAVKESAAIVRELETGSLPEGSKDAQLFIDAVWSCVVFNEDGTPWLDNVKANHKVRRLLASRATPQPTMEWEGGVLVAHHTGEGWALSVESTDGDLLGYLAWPKSWPETQTAEDLRVKGFLIV